MNLVPNPIRRAHVASVYKRWNWLSVLIAVVCILVFAQMQRSENLTFNFPQNTLLNWGAVVGSRVFNGEAWRLMTAMWMNTGVRQLVGNLCLLFLVAPFLISAMGTLPTAFIFVACGCIASVAAAMTDPNAVFVGASGAIFGMYGALVAVFMAGKFRRHSIADQKQLKYAIWLSVPLSLMMSSLPDDVSVAAYSAGLLLGCLMGYSLTDKRFFYRYGLALVSVVAMSALILFVTLAMQGVQAKVIDIFAARLSEPPEMVANLNTAVHAFIQRAIASIN